MRRPGLFLALLTLLVAPVLADVHPNTAPGFPAEQSFHVGDVDSVNLFNGALTLTIPIGGSYPVNGGFSYSLKLTYNSSPWEFLTFHRLSLVSNENVDRLQAIPNRCSNAGLGWRVSFGRMAPPCQVPDSNDTLSGRPIYQDENGTDHIFYPTLHDGDPEDAAVPGVSDVEYTRDGSYLRLKVFNDGHREIGFPDGSVRSFDTTGMPTLLKDAFGNALTITYPSTTEVFDGQSDLVWKLMDDQGRIHKIYFRTDLSPYAQTVHGIVLQAFGGGSAIYHFNYTTPTLGRPCPHNDSDPNTVGYVSNNVMVPLLSSVTLPDGSSWTASSYYAPLLTPLTPSSGSYPADACADNSGNLTALTLPTLGSLEWTWQTVYFPSGSSTKKHLQKNPGVATRTMRYANGTVQGTWTYTYAPGFPDADFSKDHTTTVVDSLNHKTVNYFSIALDPSYTGWSQYEYSLPFSRNYPINASGTTLNLSRQIFNGATLLRSEYVLYERDPTFGVVPPDFYNTNRRLLQSRTVYEDDGGVSGGVISSNFDGLGHYRTQTTDGNFPGSNTRTHFADYNSAQGTYTVNAAANTGSGYNLFPASSPWVLEAPASMSDSEGGTAQVDLCYQPGTATVTRKRVHRSGAAQIAQDLLSVYDVSAQGNVTAEKSYGGDVQGGIGPGNVCTVSLPAAPEVQINHTYSSGVRATSSYSGTTFNVLDQTIDPSTGLVSSSRDTAGLQTNYEYDAFGRLTWSEPQGAGNGGWTEYVYTPASGSIKPNVIVRRRDNGSKSATVRAVNTLVFDSFGRLFQEQKTLPDGTTAKRETDYDAVGNKRQVSEWTAGSQPGNFTQYLSYDPFGRPGFIQPPDGAAHGITMTYHGVRQVDRKVNIATGASENPATTTEIYDRQGRLLSVTEPSGSGGANVTTTYGYDVGNRLASVSTTASVGGTQVTQSRAFAYDSAGLLQSETHPEKGASGNGSVNYLQYDSRGHVLRKIDGPHDLTFSYDSAERLYQVKETGTSGRLLKSFTFAPANGTNDWRKGKLQVATRYNYVAGSTVQIDETYIYGGRDGRVSQRNTQVTTNSAAAESFTQGFTYNDLGLVNSLSYPLCTHAGCTAPAVFADVPQGAPFQREIEAIVGTITAGCGGNSYCPDNPVTRGQMALFLLKGKEGPGYTPPPCTPKFDDVPCTDPLAPWINELARRGITSGCNTTPPLYCPNNSITNAEMAVFVIQLTFQGTGFTVPPCNSVPYADVDCTYWAAKWIAEEARRQITTGCGGGNFCPGSYVTRAAMAGLIVHAFDIPYKIDPATPRNVQFSYTQGLLTGVTGAVQYGTLSYYPNLLVNQVAHVNGVNETQGNDPFEMRRPLSVGASSPYTSWSSGNYAYDGAGNIKTIGNSTFTYDPVSRLVASTQYDGANGAGNAKQQSYTFDAFGNLTSIAGTSGRNTPTSPQTNRLNGNGTGTLYDAAGNLTNWNGAAYIYDAFNQMIRMTSGTEDWGYAYTADDERIWMYNIAANTSRWTLRDLNGKVLREYLNTGAWSVGTDYIYRDGLLLAAETQTGQRHFHLDHLGTPRLITRAGGERVAYHVYYPFGEEATTFNQDSERMKFTGHERDLASSAGPGDDLDYMHARHESPVTGRFLSLDPVITDAAIGSPQRWNRYAYVTGNPLKYSDPEGEVLRLTGDVQKALADLRNIVPSEDRIFIRTKTDKDGNVIVDEKLLSSRAKDSKSGNLRRLSDVATSSKVVELNTSSPAFTVVQRDGSMVTLNFSDAMNRKGETLTAGGLSPRAGVTQIFINPFDDASQAAASLAHELVHAFLFIKGRRAEHESRTNGQLNPRGFVNRLTRTAADEARGYFDPFTPLN